MSALRVERSAATAWRSHPKAAAWGAFDWQLGFYALALSTVGLLIAWSNSGASGALAPGSTFTRGLLWFALGIVAFTIAAASDYRWLRSFSWLVYAVNIGLLVVTLAIGSGVGGSQRWVTVVGLQIQFSELSKILMVAVLAAYLAARADGIGRLSTLVGAALLAIPPFVLIVMQPDLGTALVFVAIVLGMLFVSGASMRWMTVGAAALAASLPVAWSFLRDYQQQRVLSFLNPTADPAGAGYQVIQSQIAVGSGGLFGRGLTNGVISGSDFLPVQTTDFAFSVLLEELGFVGGMVVFALFGLLIWRILVIGWRSDELFGIAFAAGMASLLVFQMLVNVGMVTGVMPVTGIPLPFITHGGASLISMAVGLGVLQSINMRRMERPDW
jgi:rod shape determining protein RodA